MVAAGELCKLCDFQSFQSSPALYLLLDHLDDELKQPNIVYMITKVNTELAKGWV